MSDDERKEIIQRSVEADYALTHLRLRDDPVYLLMSEAARLEEANDLGGFIMRNSLALYVEVNMPPLTQRPAHE